MFNIQMFLNAGYNDCKITPYGCNKFLQKRILNSNNQTCYFINVYWFGKDLFSIEVYLYNKSGISHEINFGVDRLKDISDLESHINNLWVLFGSNIDLDHNEMIEMFNL